jgi:hypothetical protein
MQTALVKAVIPYQWAVQNSTGASADFFPRIILLTALCRYPLRKPFPVVLECDGSQLLARSPDLPLYGVGESYQDAMDMLIREIESLYDDLVNDENVTAEWSQAKSILLERIRP